MPDPVFFDKPQPVTLEAIQVLTKAVLSDENKKERTFTGIAPLDEAGPNDVSFLDNRKYIDQLEQTGAGAVFVSKRFAGKVPENVIALEVAQPYRAFAQLGALFYPAAIQLPGALGDTGISPQAHVHPTAHVEDGATIEAGASIGAHAQIGRDTRICANAVIAANVTIGRACYIGPNVTLLHTMVGNNVNIHNGVSAGQDGFGFAMGAEGHLKVPQVGRVIIQDHVEIGANTTIDRGALRDTVIGEGTKIDNQVQIAHNVVIGRHCVIVSQVGISGSATLGNYVAIGGQTGVNGHITIGDGAQIAAVSVVRDDVPPGARWGGAPAKPVREWFREVATLAKLAKGTDSDKA